MKARNLQLSHDYRKYKQENPTHAFYARRRVYLPTRHGTPKNKDDVTVITETPVKAKGINSTKLVIFRVQLKQSLMNEILLVENKLDNYVKKTQGMPLSCTVREGE